MQRRNTSVNLAPHRVTPLLAARDALIWLMLMVVVGAHTARDLLQGRLGDGTDPSVRPARDAE